MPALHQRNVPDCRPIVDGGMRKCVARGLVPRRGRGGAWQNPPCQFAVPNLNSRFSYLGVPAPAGMSDSYENMSRTLIRDSLPIRHSGESRSPGVGNPVAMGLLPSQGSPTPRDFHPLMRPPQGHGDSGESTPRTPIRRRNPEGWGEGSVALGLVPSVDEGKRGLANCTYEEQRRRVIGTHHPRRRERPPPHTKHLRSLLETSATP